MYINNSSEVFTSAWKVRYATIFVNIYKMMFFFCFQLIFNTFKGYGYLWGQIWNQKHKIYQTGSLLCPITFFFKFGNHQTNKQQTYPLFLSVLLRCLRATTSSRARFWTRLLSSLTVRWARVSSGITSLAMDRPLVLPPAVEWAPGEHNLVFDFSISDVWSIEKLKFWLDFVLLTFEPIGK